MSRNKVTVLSLYLTDDEISSFRESIAQSPDFPCKLICSKSYCEFKAILSQQLVDVVTLGYPFKESEVSEWLIQSPSQRVIIFNDTKDHLAVEKIVPEKSFIHLDRETNETYLQSALQLIRWVTSPKSSEKHTLSADELIDNLGFVSVKVNESGIIQSVNEAFCKLLSCSEDDILGTSPGDWVLIHPEQFVNVIQEAGKQKISQTHETCVRWQNFAPKWIDWKIWQMNPEIFMCIGRDITENKQYVLSLQHDLQQYRMVADFTHDWEYWLDPNHSLVYISPSCQEITGYPVNAYLENPDLLLTIINPIDRAKVKKIIYPDNPITTQNTEFRITTLSGETRWIGHISQPIYDDSGIYYGQRASNRDITEQKHTERILREQRNLAINLSVTDHQTDALEEVLKTSLQIHPIDSGWIHLVGKNNNELTLVAYKGLLREFARGLFKFPPNFAFTRRMMEGQPVYISHNELRDGFEGIRFPSREEMRSIGSIPVFYRGKIVAILNFGSHSHTEIPRTTRDILEGIAAQLGGVIARTRAESRLIENLTNIQLLFNALDNFLFILNPKGNIIYFNPASQERLGYSETELLTMNLQDLIPATWQKDSNPPNSDVLDRLSDRQHISLITKKGLTIPVEMSIIQGKWGDENVLFCISYDVSQQENIESLLNSDANFRAIAQSTSAAILVHTDEKLSFINPAAERIYGYRADELIGKNVFEVINVPNKMELTDLMRKMYLPEQIKLDKTDIQCTGKDGIVKYIHLEFSPILFNNKHSVLTTAHLIK